MLRFCCLPLLRCQLCMNWCGSSHWRRQLWGTGARAPSTSNFNFSGHFRATQTNIRLHWLPIQKISLLVSCPLAPSDQILATSLAVVDSFHVKTSYFILIYPNSPSHWMKWCWSFCSKQNEWAAATAGAVVIVVLDAWRWIATVML